MDFLKRIFGKRPTRAGRQTNPQPPSPEPAVVVTSRVLMMVFDPVLDAASGEKLSQRMNWHRPDDHATQFITDILYCSGGMARYQIVDRVDVGEFPVKVDGFRYTPQSYLAVMNKTAPAHSPDTINYGELLARYNLLERVASNQIDEIWAFGFPYAGFYESTMGGPGAFFCNSAPLNGTGQSLRRFIVMGFSLERGVGEMFEAMGHRAESIMEKVYEKTPAAKNMWQKFIRYDKTHPGQAECGNVHFAPNSERDYDWGNSRYVASRCEDWLTYPNFKNVVKQVNCAEWGNGEIRAHHVWWFKHMPKVGGYTDGVANNWWQYIIDPNRVSV